MLKKFLVISRKRQYNLYYNLQGDAPLLGQKHLENVSAFCLFHLCLFFFFLILVSVVIKYNSTIHSMSSQRGFEKQCETKSC